MKFSFSPFPTKGEARIKSEEEEKKICRGMIKMQCLASQRPLWIAAIPLASGSLPRTEGSFKLPIREVHFPNSWGLTSRLFAISLTSKCGLCRSIFSPWPLMSLHSNQGLSVQNGIYCRLKKPSRKREREHSMFILSFLM